MAGSRLCPQNWNAGDRLSIVDLIDLTGTNSQQMIDELNATAFKSKSFKYRHVEPDGKRVVINSLDKD